jgi:hypothetical protein
MTCESPIDRGDSRSYSITLLFGSHRVKGHERAGLSVEGGSAFSCFPRKSSQTHGGTARWRGWPSSARETRPFPHVLRSGLIRANQGLNDRHRRNIFAINLTLERLPAHLARASMVHARTRPPPIGGPPPRVLANLLCRNSCWHDYVACRQSERYRSLGMAVRLLPRFRPGGMSERCRCHVRRGQGRL